MGRKIRRSRAKSEHVERVLANVKAQSGLDREAHFAAGKDLASWRGVRTVTTNRKREASRLACRRKATLS